MKINSLLIILIIACVTLSCKSKKEDTVHQPVEKKNVSVKSQDWGIVEGQKVYLFTLTNGNGIEVTITNFGGIVTSWMVPSHQGGKDNIVLGFKTLDEYVNKPHPYFGALVGRYGNRIAKGKFSIDGVDYTLAKNNGENHLHGGIKSFGKVVWNAEIDSSSSPAKLKLTYLSKDGEEGYPGNLNVTVFYSLTDNNELTIEYEAETDKPTHCNLTNHSYFNLSGDISKNILGHYLTLYADHYTPVDNGLIPTGEIKAVKGTAFDFTSAHKIGERIEQVQGGYDHNFVLNRKDQSMMLAAVLADSVSKRKIETFTTEPGIQFYSGNFLDGTLSSSDGIPFNKHAGMCLETQHFPDTPNRPNFPTTLLRPGEKYKTTTIYKFSAE